MVNTSGIMMDLLASEVCGRKVDTDKYILSDNDLKCLYKLSKAHDLAHIVGDALIKNNMIKSGEVKTAFEKQVVTAVYRYEKISYALDSLKKVLSEAGICFVPLKGAVIRGYYPEPWMRTSCDIDILVHEEQAEIAAQVISERLGYQYEKRAYHDISMISSSGIHLELHFSIQENMGNIDRVLSDCWSYVSDKDDNEAYFSSEFFFFHQLAHAAYHFLGGGCGVRPVLDIWILNHHIEYDMEALNRLLKQCGIYTFACELERLSEVWFGTAEHTEITRQMEGYLLNGGVYGTMSNHVAVQQVKKGGKLRYAGSRIWLKYDALSQYYPSLEGKRFLLPVYEVRRWVEIVLKGRAKKSLHELKLNASTTADEQIMMNDMLQKLGLHGE